MARGRRARQTPTQQWRRTLNERAPEQRAEFERRMRGELPSGFDEALAAYKAKLCADAPTIATRKAGEAALNVIAPLLPELVTGSADLTGSTNTKVATTPDITPDDASGRYVHWGIREHGMAAACNGLALHGGLIPSGASFLVFTDYCRPSLRLAALMRLRVVHVFTHDSIGLGEDGPTHQPVEQLAALRAIPNLLIFRPADSVETVECWQARLESRHAPSILSLTRQNLPALRRSPVAENLCARGAYEISPASRPADVSIFASGSEVSLAVAAQAILEGKGVPTRVVSVPCMDLFLQRPVADQREVIGSAKAKVGVEAAVRQGWDALIGDGPFIGMTGFGASGPYQGALRAFRNYRATGRRGSASRLRADRPARRRDGPIVAA